MSTFVIGHKNPDTDAICSAIGYADLLSRTSMPDALPARCGEVNSRTAFVLEKAELVSPRLLMDVRPTAAQILRREVISAHEDESLSDVFERMRRHGLRNIPVLDKDQRMTGLASIMKMLDLFLPGGDQRREARIVPTNLRRICKSVAGVLQNEGEMEEDEEFILTVAAMRAEAFGKRLKEYPAKRILLVVGNRPTIQKPALEYGVRCLVITGGYELDPELLALAKAKGVVVILTDLDTATTTLAIKCAKPVIHALTSDFMSFRENTLISDIQEKVRATPQMLFPVLDSDHKISGVFSKSDLISPPLTKLVLVDHNEFSQAVTGVEEAEVLEVLDHHRLGGNLVTREPIRFINDPLGSTCTIVSRLYRQNGLTPSPSIALCLAAGIIADTLNLTSPTATPQDKEILLWLGTLTKINLKSFSEEFFSRGSALQVLTSEEVVGADAKEYTENGWKIVAAQIEELGLDQFWKRQEELASALDAMRKERGLDFACLLITDITLHYSLLLTCGSAKILNAIDYPQLSPNLFELEGIVSRKKQLLPVLIRILNHTTKSA
ncbi:MAG: putative manganese-dependent inorganic diphosphatase [Blastochloris sp.]|nr:putative manganese-dependent inorganic diphosphatase [Blastochloris sp.]